MSEMIERVAAALRATEATLSNPEARSLARTAIEAMREPTDAMYDEMTIKRKTGLSTTEEIWCAGINAALT